MIAKNPADRFNQVVDHGVCRRDPAAAARSSAAPYPVRTRMPRRADRPRRARRRAICPRPRTIAPDRDREIRGGAIDHSAARLAAVASARIRRHRAVGMVRTIVIRVDVRAAAPRAATTDGGAHRHRRLGEQAAGDAGLVRGHDDRKTRLVERANGIDRPRITAAGRGGRADTRRLRSACRRDRGKTAPAAVTASAAPRRPRGQRRRLACSDDRSGIRASCTAGTRRGCVNTAWPSPAGRVTRSSVGPKTAVTRMPIAAPRCIAPESFDTSARHAARVPASVGRSVPIRFRTRRSPSSAASISRADRQVRAAADHHRLDAIVGQRASERGEVRGRPALGAAVRRARRERDQRPHAIPAGAASVRQAPLSRSS